MGHLIDTVRHAAAAVVLLAAAPLHAADAAQPPDLDLSIRYYSRVLTPEGVLRESRYEERMVRRRDHVWTARVLPQEGMREEQTGEEHEHKHFNYVVLPRHVIRDGNGVKLEFVDVRERTVVSIAPSEYESVNFDGSWANAFFLADPRQVAALPVTARASAVAGARWHEQEKNGVFRRVLWDEKRMVPLVIETGNRQDTFYRRMEIMPQSTLSALLPWQGTASYAQKEYADFLD
jgi:hypothetical protein